MDLLNHNEERSRDIELHIMAMIANLSLFQHEAQ